MKALLIIDMQVGSFSGENPRPDRPVIVGRINAISDFYRKNGFKVIFIQHDGTKENEFLSGSSDWEILPDLIKEPNDFVVSKTANAAFYQTDLHSILQSNGVKEIAITGSATDFCVEATLQAALLLDYDITVIGDAHTMADRQHLKAETLIKHYNWVWSNLTPTSGHVKVVSHEDHLFQEA